MSEVDEKIKALLMDSLNDPKNERAKNALVSYFKGEQNPEFKIDFCWIMPTVGSSDDERAIASEARFLENGE